MKDNEMLKHVEQIDDTTGKMLKIMLKPENKIEKAIEIAGGVISVLSILSIVDILKNWIGG